MAKTATSKFADVIKKLMGSGGVEVFLELEPSPASRPRVTRMGNVYYGKLYDQFRKEAKAQLRKHTGSPMLGDIICFVEIIGSKPKTTKRQHPRGDCDNFVKGPLDAMTDVETFWNDDDQITCLAVTKRYAEPDEPAGVRVYLKEVENVAK